jgi:uncharacterized protein YndB with AHSA1/START domain
MQDRIEKRIELRAPLSRVWRALVDYQEFGEWFRVKLEGPFEVGEVARGQTTFPGFEGMKWEATVVAMEPERLFAFEWCPYEHDEKREYASSPKTLVEFRLEPTTNGTRLIISESGFSALPDDARRFDALRSNSQGWNVQANALASYVES